MEKYKGGQFCDAIGCSYNKSRKEGYKQHCIAECRAYEMHQWLEENGFEIVKREAVNGEE